MAYLFQQILNGLHIGSIYALLAFGYALTYGILRRANLAHGAIFAFGGQVGILGAVFGWNVLWLTFPAALGFGVLLAFAFAGLAAHVISRHVLEPLRAGNPNTIVASTLAVAIVLMELGRMAMDSRDLWLPPVLASTVVFLSDGAFAVTLTLIQLVDMAIVAAAVSLAAAWLARSRFGASWRAVCDDPLAAAMCGIDSRRVFRATVVVSGMLAALAGVLAAIHFGNISFDTGLVFGLKVLFVAALGLGGSPLSAAAGAMSVGLAESLWTGYFPGEWRDAGIFSALVLLLVLRSTDLARHHNI
ncbi:MAG: branched-chain amino acid ABC transporter permease [Mesorhizobium sp.]|nr:branched-chain amino acid ABC transporter permease [Mesorhizobium sp.]MCO5162401.1 branched-chain amino acid ABC transporter permease [Mesorhizobium sp.]